MHRTRHQARLQWLSKHLSCILSATQWTGPNHDDAEKRDAGQRNARPYLAFCILSIDDLIRQILALLYRCSMMG